MNTEKWSIHIVAFIIALVLTVGLVKKYEVEDRYQFTNQSVSANPVCRNEKYYIYNIDKSVYEEHPLSKQNRYSCYEMGSKTKQVYINTK